MTRSAISKTGRNVPSPWAWSLVVLTICGASGGVNAVLDRRHPAAPPGARSGPFPLERLPMRIGGWKARDKAIEIDAKTLLISGCASHVARLYKDETTGVRLTVLVGFGPAERVAGHTPEICFPAFGFEPEGKPIEPTIGAGPGSTPARFRSSVYVMPGGAAAERIEVVYGFRQDGRWTPDPASGRKRSRNDPGVLKVQIERPVAPGERCDGNGPACSFLAALVPEIEAAIRAGGTRPRG